MIPRFGNAPRPERSYRHRPGIYVILPRGSDLLLTHQSGDDGEFQLPGGGIDPGEAPLTALYREVLEETGWTIARPRRLSVFRHYKYMPDYDLLAEKVCHIYVAHPVRAIAPPSEPGHTALWMAADLALTELASPGDRAMLARYLG